MGFFDQFINSRLLDKYPRLYVNGFLCKKFNIKRFWQWSINGVYHSLILYYVMKGIWKESAMDNKGDIGGHWMLGATLFSSILLTVLLRASLTIEYVYHKKNSFFEIFIY